MPNPGDGQAGFTIVQWITFVGTFVGGALAAFVGAKVKTRRTSGEGVEWFYDGPVANALKIFQGIYTETVEGRREQRQLSEERNKKLDEQTNILRQIKECITREWPPRRR